jgi:hypothetical protein
MEDFLASVPELDCYNEYDDPPRIIPGRAERDWMQNLGERLTDRCTPLSIANASGWEVTSPVAFSASWDGGIGLESVKIESLDGDCRLQLVAASVFGRGVLTFHPGYLFRTTPGWGLFVRGAPNAVKDGIFPLESLIETDWLPFTFTMNWRFARPGTVVFEKGESFCFLMLVPHAILDNVQPRLRRFDDNPEVRLSYETWRKARAEFQAGMEGQVEEGCTVWAQARPPANGISGLGQSAYHLTTRRLKAPF